MMRNQISRYKRPVLIAEVGCNHMGNMEIAKKMLDSLSVIGIKNVKFQKRNIKKILSNKQYNGPHPNPENSFGKTYGQHREFLEFDINQHKLLQKYCKKKKIIYSTSVWDEDSALEIIKLNPEYIKVPSGCNLDFNLLEVLRDKYKKEVHLSLGMTTHKEEEKIISFFEKKNFSKKKLIIYSCVSGYPVPPEDLSLLDIVRLKNKFGSTVKSVGFSGHHNGISSDIAAYVLGASHIERHFTLDRTWKGTDHAASLEPHGFQKLNRDLSNVYLGLRYKKSEILEIEKPHRKKLKRIIR